MESHLPFISVLHLYRNVTKMKLKSEVARLLTIRHPSWEWSCLLPIRGHRIMPALRMMPTMLMVTHTPFSRAWPSVEIEPRIRNGT